jgi:hypothetical protein
MTRRALLIAAGVAAAVAGIVVGVVVLRLDHLIRNAVEERGTALIGTAVHVDAVEVGLAAGHARLRGLTIANPPGFSSAYALTLGEVELDVGALSLLSDPVVIDVIRVIGPHVFYELNAAGEANIDVIRKYVEAQRHAPDAPAPTPGEGKKRRRERSGPRLVIHLLEMREGEVTIDAVAAGGKTRTEELPPFELTAIGVRQGGATPAEAGREILIAMARDVALAVAADDLEKVVGKQVGGILGGLLKKGGSGAIGQGLGGILDKILKKETPADAGAP